MTCDRCRRETVASIGSMFNTEQVCPDCKRAEEAHPEYARAVKVENAAVARGDVNFRDIGLPPELRAEAAARREQEAVS